MSTVARVAPTAAREPGWWGMVLLVATEATVFALLLASYFYLQSRTTGLWPPDGIARPKLLVPTLMTVLLMASSIPAALADRRAARGDRRGLVTALLATLVLGAAFLGLQAWEYVERARVFTPRTDAYGSLFYTITGLHGAHVAAGLLLLAWAAVLGLRGAFEQQHLAVTNVSLYWHFVHGVWLFVFLSLYLVPAL
jgi:heme/copper-type cytochrome/quinol oxidase subunit 3